MNIQPISVDLTDVVKKWTPVVLWEVEGSFDKDVFTGTVHIDWLWLQKLILFVDPQLPEDGKKAWTFGFLYVNGRERKIFEMDSKWGIKNEKFTAKAVGKFRRGTFLSQKVDEVWENVLDFAVESIKDNNVVKWYKITVKNSQNSESTAVAADVVAEVPPVDDTSDLPF